MESNLKENKTNNTIKAFNIEFVERLEKIKEKLEPWFDKDNLEVYETEVCVEGTHRTIISINNDGTFDNKWRCSCEDYDFTYNDVFEIVDDGIPLSDIVVKENV